MNAFILTIVIIGGAHQGEFFNVIPNDFATPEACMREANALKRQMLADGTIAAPAEVKMTCEGRV